MKTRILLLLFSLSGLTMAACSSSKTLPSTPSTHRYFIELDRPGSVYSLLENPKYKGAIVPLIEMNENGQPGDTLQAWVQHYNGRNRFSSEAERADIIIACHRESQPRYAQEMHVLPESTGEIFVYMMEGGLLIVSDERISFYDVLIAARKSR